MENTATQKRRVPRMTYAQAGEINGMVPPQAVELGRQLVS